MQFLQRFQNDVRHVQLIEKDLAKAEERSKIKVQSICKKYNEETGLQLQKIRRRNDLFIRYQKKKEQPLDTKQIPKFVQASLELEKNKGVSLIAQRRIYEVAFKQNNKILQEVLKEYNDFSNLKNQETKHLNQKIAELVNGIEEVTNNYISQSEEKIEMAKKAQIRNQNPQHVDLIPFISQKIDKLFQRQLCELNFGSKQLFAMKQRKNDVLGKIQYLIDLIKQKQLEKKLIDEQNDKQIQYIQGSREQLLKRANEAKTKLKQAQQLQRMFKEEERRHLVSVFYQKNKFDSYQHQVDFYQRQIKIINKQIANSRDREERYFQKLKNKPIDQNQRIEDLIARDREKDEFILEKKREQKELQKQKIFFEKLAQEQIKRKRVLAGQIPEQKEDQQKKKQLLEAQRKSILQFSLIKQKKKDDELNEIIQLTKRKVAEQGNLDRKPDRPNPNQPKK